MHNFNFILKCDVPCEKWGGREVTQLAQGPHSQYAKMFTLEPRSVRF